jgi:hypothetical protein
MEQAPTLPAARRALELLAKHRTDVEAGDQALAAVRETVSRIHRSGRELDEVLEALALRFGLTRYQYEPGRLVELTIVGRGLEAELGPSFVGRLAALEATVRRCEELERENQRQGPPDA